MLYLNADIKNFLIALPFISIVGWIVFQFFRSLATAPDPERVVMTKILHHLQREAAAREKDSKAR